MDKIVDDNIKYKDIFDLVEYGKQGNKIIWIRDGSHSTNDLQIILEFQKQGFLFKLYNYKGEFEKSAIRIEFTYKK